MEQRKITFASTETIETLGDLLDEFMWEVFELQPGDHLTTDEADLRDYAFLDSWDTTEIWARITEVYGVAREDVANERVTSVLAAIQRRKHPQ